MKLAIVGSRTFDDYELLEKTMFEFFQVQGIRASVISGGAKGADSLAEKFAKKWDWGMLKFLPDWDKYGKSAGFRRNQQIVDACDMVLVFWDGASRGTQDSINKAKLAKKPTFIIYF